MIEHFPIFETKKELLTNFCQVFGLDQFGKLGKEPLINLIFNKFTGESYFLIAIDNKIHFVKGDNQFRPLEDHDYSKRHPFTKLKIDSKLLWSEYNNIIVSEGVLYINNLYLAEI